MAFFLFLGNSLEKIFTPAPTLLIKEMPVTVSKASFRRYGRANYDITPRLHNIGEEIYIETRCPLDSYDLLHVNDQVARGTYSQQCKAYPRTGSTSSCISVVIASTYPPHCDVSKEQLQKITSRLMRPTCVSKLKQSRPVQSAPVKKETASSSKGATSRRSSPSRSLDRSYTRMTSANSSSNLSTRDSYEKDRTSSSKKSFSTYKGLKGLPTSPAVASNGTIAAFSVYPVFDPIRFPVKKPTQEKHWAKRYPNRPSVTIHPATKSEKQKKVQKKQELSPAPPSSSPQQDARPKRLGLIATILETVDERDML